MPVFLVRVFKGLAKANAQTLETHALKAVAIDTPRLLLLLIWNENLNH